MLGFDKTVYIIYYEKKKINHKFYLEDNLTNIINFNNNKLMMSLYNEEKEKDEIKYISIIRELDIEIKEGKIIEIKSINTNNEKQYNIIENNELNENVNNNINEVDNKKYYIKNIIEINNSLILINTKDGKIMTLKKKMN